MRNTEYLFDLIRSMSRQEKRYFKLRARYYSRDSANVYTTLFDIADSLEVGSEKSLKAATAGEAFAKHLPTYKYQLTKLILDALAAFHRSRSINAELREYLSHIEVLYNRGLYEHCSKLVSRARKKAAKYEKSEYVIELLAWERKLLFKNVADDLESALKQHYVESKAQIEAAYTSRLYLELIDEVQSACRRYARLRDNKDRDIIEAALKNPLLHDPQRATTFASRVARLGTLGIYAWVRGCLDEALRYQSEAITLWENNPHHIEDRPEWYANYLTNYLTYCIGLKHFEDFEATVKKIRATPAKTHATTFNNFESVMYLELSYYLNVGKIDAALTLTTEIEDGLERFSGLIRPNRLMTLHHNCAILYFICDDFAQALNHVNAILNYGITKVKQDIQEFARVFRLLILFEMKLIGDLESLFRSARRYLDKHKDAQQYSIETHVIASLKRLLNAADKHTRTLEYRSLQNTLNEVLHSVSDTEPVGLMELLMWLRSKIEGIALRDVYTAAIESSR